MKQTAVEWLIDESMTLVFQYMKGTLNEDTLDDVIYKIGTKAKEMEKEQIMDAYYQGDADSDNIHVDAEQYYKETFKSEEDEIL